jgi:hypothetical protein
MIALKGLNVVIANSRATMPGISSSTKTSSKLLPHPVLNPPRLINGPNHRLGLV